MPIPFLMLRSSAADLLLKATTKKLVTIAGYTRKDGSFVPQHQKLVHYNDQMSFADVVSGNGSHSQKIAHAKLSAEDWWQKMDVTDKAVAVMSVATDIQEKASSSAAVSGWKKLALAGKNPSPGQWAAFNALSTDKKAGLLDAVKAGPGLGHLKSPALPVPPEKAPAITDGASAAAAQAFSASLESLNIPADMASLLMGQSVTMKDGTTVSSKDYVDGLLADGYGSPMYYSTAKGSQAGYVFKPGKPKATLNSIQLYYAGLAIDAQKKTNQASGGSSLKKQWSVGINSGAHALPADKGSLENNIVPDGLDYAEANKWAAAHAKAHGLSMAQYQTTEEYAVAVHPRLQQLYGAVKEAFDKAQEASAKAVKEALSQAGLKAGDKFVVPAKSILGIGGTLHVGVIAMVGGKPVVKFSQPITVSSGGKLTGAKSLPISLGMVAAQPKPQAQPATAALPDAPAAQYPYIPPPQALAAVASASDLSSPAIPQSDLDAHSALAAMENGPHYQKVAIAKLKNDPAWASLPPAQKHEQAMALYHELQGVASQAAAVSMAKKAMLAGKVPSKGQYLALVASGGDSMDKVASAVGHEKYAELMKQAAVSAGPEGKAAVKKLVDSALAQVNSVTAALAPLPAGVTGVQIGQKAKAAIDSLSLPELQAIAQTPGLPPVSAAYIAHKLSGMAGSSQEAVVALGPKDGDTKQGADGILVFKDGHWHKQAEPTKPLKAGPSALNPTPKVTKVTSQPAAQGAASSASGKPIHGAAIAGTPDKPMPMTGWKQIGEQAGSNPGGKFKDDKGGEWYVKFPADADIAKNEFLADKLYELLGVAGPKSFIVSRGGKIGVAHKWVNLKKSNASGLSKLDGSKAALPIDAWLANWDVVGAAHDNLQVGPDGKAFRVDAGGSLLYRAQGGPKGAAFGNDVTELESMQDAKTNPQAASVFAGTTKADMAWGLGQLAKLKPSQIESLVGDIGPGSAVQKKRLAATLIARRDFILKKFGITDPWNKPPVDESKVPGVVPSKLPPAIDFSNINGKPLSSKKHVNDQNTKDSQALADFAAKGNLAALKSYKYDAVNKETGADIGKKPIEQHPAKKIVEQWSDSVQALQSIAYPFQESLAMAAMAVGLSGAADASRVAGYFHAADSVSTVSSEHAWGFFMHIGSFGQELADATSSGKASFFASDKHEVIGHVKTAYQKLSQPVKSFISSVQDSGSINHLWSKGQTSSGIAGLSKQELAKKLYDESMDMPEGMEVWRWMHDSSKETVKALLSAKPGDVLQNTDSMCCSRKKEWGSSSHFGSAIRLRIRAAEGAKILPTFGSGGFASEAELTTLPGARYVVTKVEKGTPSNSDGVSVELVMLPPDPGYLATLAQEAALKKSMHQGQSWKNVNHKSFPRLSRVRLLPDRLATATR